MDLYLSTLKLDDVTRAKVVALHNKYDKHGEVEAEVYRWELLRLEFSNMFSYGENQVIDFKGMNGKIVGIFAPNRYGKSSIFDIILFTLFEKTSRGTSKLEIINKRKISMSCMVEILIGEDVYTVRRYNTGKKFYVNVLKNGVMVDMEIEKIVGTYNDFVMTSLSLQNNNIGFVNFKQSDRKDYLYQILDLNKYDKIEEEVKSDVKILKGKQKIVVDEIGVYEKHCSAENIRKNKEEIDEIESQIMETKEDMEILYTLIADEGKKLIQSMPKKVKVVNVPEPYVGDGKPEDEIESLKEKIIRNDERLRVMVVVREPIIKNEYMDMVDKIRKLKSVRDESEKRESRIKVLQKRMESYKEHKYNPECHYCCMNEKVVAFNETLRELEELRGGGVGVGVGVDVGVVYNENELNMAIEKYKKCIEEENKRVSEIMRKNEENERRVADDKKGLEKKNKKYKAKIEKLKGSIMYDEWKAYEDAKKHNKGIRGEINRLEIEKTKHIDKICELEKKKTKCECMVEKYTEYEKKLKDLVRINSEYEEEMRIFKIYLKLVSGYALFMLDEVVPQLMREINEILKLFVDFRIKISVGKSKVEVSVYYENDEIRKWNATNCSGFEQFIINLAFKIVIGKISNTKSPNFVAIDEGWGCFDSENLDRVGKVFDIMKQFYKFVIIISHLDILKEKVDMNINIVCENGESSIK